MHKPAALAQIAHARTYRQENPIKFYPWVGISFPASLGENGIPKREPGMFFSSAIVGLRASEEKRLRVTKGGKEGEVEVSSGAADVRLGFSFG